jgi:hypothetical protein
MKKQVLKLIFMSVLCVLISFTVRADWENPSEKYKDSYKQFVKARCPIGQDKIKHYVYFSRDRTAIHHHPFLQNSRFEGAQIMYSWKQLEPVQGTYDFSAIRDDYQYLKTKGKKLFVQLQDTTFDPRYKAIPDYLTAAKYDGGAIYQRTDSGEPEGWVAKRWNPNVRKRFALLLAKLGKVFDGKIAGINLQESSIGVSNQYDKSFTPAKYVQSLKANMLALKQAFPNSTTLQYANFIPGEWLPWEDHGYLKSIYQYGEKIGVGLGAPDLMVRRKGQLNHALALMHEGHYSVPLGIAIQDGNYIGQTNTTRVVVHHNNLVPLLHAFAKDFLKVKYMFWRNQAPYFQQDVLPCFISE